MFDLLDAAIEHKCCRTWDVIEEARRCAGSFFDSDVLRRAGDFSVGVGEVSSRDILIPTISNECKFKSN